MPNPFICIVDNLLGQKMTLLIAFWRKILKNYMPSHNVGNFRIAMPLTDLCTFGRMITPLFEAGCFCDIVEQGTVDTECMIRSMVFCYLFVELKRKDFSNPGNQRCMSTSTARARGGCAM